MSAFACEYAGSGTYELGHHVRIQFNVALAIPVDVHVEFDALCLGFGDNNAIEFHRHGAEVDLSEMKRFL